MSLADELLPHALGHPLPGGMIPRRPCEIVDLLNVIDASVPDLDSSGVPAHTNSPLATICTLPPTWTVVWSPSLAACRYRSEGRPISYPCSTRTSTESVPR